jgi:hypothetical protein
MRTGSPTFSNKTREYRKVTWLVKRMDTCNACPASLGCFFDGYSENSETGKVDVGILVLV